MRRAHAITPHMLYSMAPHVDRQNPQEWAAWVAMLMGFFTFARRSNLVPRSAPAFNPLQQLQRSDVIVGQGQLFVIFKWTKTIQFNERALVIPVTALPTTPICPVEAYLHLINLVPAAPQDPAFGVLRKGHVRSISQGLLQEQIKTLIKKINLDPTNFSSHSLRRGGASWASRAGCGSTHIQAFGDWKSDCYLIYIQSSLEQRHQVAAKMSAKILQEYAQDKE